MIPVHQLPENLIFDLQPIKAKIEYIYERLNELNDLIEDNTAKKQICLPSLDEILYFILFDTPDDFRRIYQIASHVINKLYYEYYEFEDPNSITFRELNPLQEGLFLEIITEITETIYCYLESLKLIIEGQLYYYCTYYDFRSLTYFFKRYDL